MVELKFSKRVELKYSPQKVKIHKKLNIYIYIYINTIHGEEVNFIITRTWQKVSIQKQF